MEQILHQINSFKILIYKRLLIVSYDKTQYLLLFICIICTQLLNQKITICNDYNKSDSPNYFEIKRATKTKYLGLILDCKWNFHVPIKYSICTHKLLFINNFVSIKSSPRYNENCLCITLSVYFTIWGGTFENKVKTNSFITKLCCSYLP